MKILLWQDVDKLGKRGEVVEVREGYARNFIFPRRLGSKPTPSMYKEFELEKRRVAKQEAVLVSESKAVAEKLGGVTSVSIEVNTNEEGHLGLPALRQRAFPQDIGGRDGIARRGAHGSPPPADSGGSADGHFISPTLGRGVRYG